MMAAMVAEGTLPPVEERLPEEPLVVTPLESVGTYGGTIRLGTQFTGCYDGDCALLGTRQELLRITPNIHPVGGAEYLAGLDRIGRFHLDRCLHA